MCTLTANELRIAVSEFRDKAHKFFENAKEKAEFPFEELFFMETVTVAYELMLSGKKTDGSKIVWLATKKIMSENPMFSRIKAYLGCKKVVDGNRNGMIFSWQNYCEKYLERAYPDDFHDRRREMWCNHNTYEKLMVTYTSHEFAYLVCCVLGSP